MKISETEKDYSACHTDNKSSFLSRERGKKYILSMNSFLPCKFHVAKMHILAVLVTQIPVCFNNKKINL